jgi:hypothetical protein
MSAVLILVFVAVVPPITLVPVSSVGAIVSSVPSGWFSRIQRRSAEVEPYRTYRLDADQSISPAEAGEILNTLMYVGRGMLTREGMLPQVRIYEDRWFPEWPGEDRNPGDPLFWGASLWAELAGGRSPELVTYLRQVEVHPAHVEFSRLARAQAIDILGGRYEIPFSDDMVSSSIPSPTYSGIRNAAQSHLGIAALRASEGRHEEAEEAIREVISVGFLLMEDAVSPVGYLVGGALMQAGGEALVLALTVRGRGDEADALSTRVAAARRAVAMLQSSTEPGAQARMRALMTVAANPERRRSLRWEYLQFISGITPCMNLQRVVFGPSDEYNQWVEDMRGSLVRYASDDSYFDVALRGIVAGGEPSFFVGLLAVAMGGSEAQGSCAQLVLNLGPTM